MSNLEFEPPKYARVVLELRRRIENGDYPPGSMLPSESQLVREFAVGRTTVVRALQMMQQDGWIKREHGLGSYVKGVPGKEGSIRPGLAVLDQPEARESVTVIAVGDAEPPPPVRAVLGEPARLVMRRWVDVRDDVPSELVTCWFPPQLAYGTDLDQAAPLSVGVRAHLRAVKGLHVDHITERLTARLPSSDESKALKIRKGEPVLGIVATVHDASDAVLFVVEVVMPGAVHELEDVYQVSD